MYINHIVLFPSLIYSNSVHEWGLQVGSEWDLWVGGFATDPPTFDDTATAIQTLPDHFKKEYKVLEYNSNFCNLE